MQLFLRLYIYILAIIAKLTGLVRLYARVSFAINCNDCGGCHFSDIFRTRSPLRMKGTLINKYTVILTRRPRTDRRGLALRKFRNDPE